MTREEAIKHFDAWAQCNYANTRDAALMALSALRPVSREQVKRAWPGCDYCHMKEALFDCGTFLVEIGHQNIVGGACIIIDSYGGFGIDYCPICGRPLTDEAVEMVMERLKAMKMREINSEIESLVAEMREVGKLPAPSKEGNHNNLLRYNEIREKILEKFLEAFEGGYRLEKEALKDGL